jgi:hypothetical protein
MRSPQIYKYLYSEAGLGVGSTCIYGEEHGHLCVEPLVLWADSPGTQTSAQLSKCRLLLGIGPGVVRLDMIGDCWYH